MKESQILELMNKLESQNSDDASWCWIELRRLLEETAAQQGVQADGLAHLHTLLFYIGECICGERNSKIARR